MGSNVKIPSAAAIFMAGNPGAEIDGKIEALAERGRRAIEAIRGKASPSHPSDLAAESFDLLIKDAVAMAKERRTPSAVEDLEEWIKEAEGAVAKGTSQMALAPEASAAIQPSSTQTSQGTAVHMDAPRSANTAATTLTALAALGIAAWLMNPSLAVVLLGAPSEGGGA